MATPLVAGVAAGLKTRKAGGGFGSALKTAGSAFFKATPIGQKFEKLKLEGARIRDLQSRTELSEEQGVREETRLDIAEAGEARNVAKQEKLDAPVGMKQLLAGFGTEAQKNIRNFLERRDLIDDDTDSIRREDANEMLGLLRKTPSLQSELNRAILKDFDSGIAPLEAQLQDVVTKAIEKTGLSRAELMANPGLDTSGKLEKVLNQLKPLERDRGFVLADIRKGVGQKQKAKGEEQGKGEFQAQIDALNQQAVEQGVGEVSPLMRDAILRATGIRASGFKFLAKAVGGIIPGEQFPKTQEAINDINLFNQQVVAAVALSPRFNEGEINRIKKFLVQGGAFFADPPFALRQLLGLREIFESSNVQMLGAINRGTVTPKQTEQFLEKINVNNIVLSLIPSRENLQSPSIFKQEQRGKTIEDIDKMSLQDIKNFPKSGLNFVSPEVRKEMLRRLETGKGITSGGF